jgi:phospholipid/cholesterol/gamma-HCH transport system substrate-binding protein
VRVRFRVKNAWVGNESTVSIKIKTVLGRKYLAIDSVGPAKQDPHQLITRTTVPGDYDIVPVFSKLTQTSNEIDSDQLAASFRTIADAFRDTPDTVRQTLTGLQRLSTTIAARDAALRSLLTEAKKVTDVLADRSAQIVQLLKDGSLLFDELNLRRQAIQTLFVNTSNLAQQLSGLVADNTDQLQPALDQVNKVLAILQRNRDNLDHGLALLAPFVRLFANTLGNGRWFDNYICNLNLVGLLYVTTPSPPGSTTDTGCDA